MPRPGLVITAGALGVVLAGLAGCGVAGGDGDQILPVAYPTALPGDEECEAATVRILQTDRRAVSPNLDAAAVQDVVGNGSPACVGRDAGALDRIYAAAADSFRADPTGQGVDASPDACKAALLRQYRRDASGPLGPATRAPECVLLESAEYAALSREAAEAVQGDEEAGKAAAEQRCAAAYRTVLKEGLAAERRGKDRAAAEDAALDRLEGDQPCAGVPKTRRKVLYLRTYDEVRG